MPLLRFTDSTGGTAWCCDASLEYQYRLLTAWIDYAQRNRLPYRLDRTAARNTLSVTLSDRRTVTVEVIQ